MTLEQEENLRKWHRWVYTYYTADELEKCLKAINAVLGTQLYCGKRDEQKKTDYGKKIYDYRTSRLISNLTLYEKGDK